MKLFSNLLIVALTAFLSSCNAIKNTDPESQIIWVASEKADCTGVGKMKCLQIQRGKVIEEGQWKLLYSGIEGFNHEFGYTYKLKVKEQIHAPEETPADASTKTYSLLEIIEKNIDEKWRLNDIWIATSINGETLNPIDSSGIYTPPRLEVNISEKKVFGSDGCNNYFGSIISLNDSEFKLGPLGSSMKMCPNMEVSDSFITAIQKVNSYNIIGLNLTLKDKDGKSLITFKKVD